LPGGCLGDGNGGGAKRRKQRGGQERPAERGRRRRGPFARAIQKSPALLRAPRKNDVAGLRDLQESPRNRWARAAKSPDRCGEIEMPRGRRRRAANCAPRRLSPLARPVPAVPSPERQCLPSDGCTRTKPFRRECSGVFQFGRERRIRSKASQLRRLFSERRIRPQAALEQMDWQILASVETCGRRFLDR